MDRLTSGSLLDALILKRILSYVLSHPGRASKSRIYNLRLLKSERERERPTYSDWQSESGDGCLVTRATHICSTNKVPVERFSQIKPLYNLNNCCCCFFRPAVCLKIGLNQQNQFNLEGKRVIKRPAIQLMVIIGQQYRIVSALGYAFFLRLVFETHALNAAHAAHPVCSAQSSTATVKSDSQHSEIAAFSRLVRIQRLKKLHTGVKW